MNVASVIAFLKKWRTAVAFVLMATAIGLVLGVASYATYRSNLKRAEQGDMVAVMALAARYKERERYDRAANWYRQAAEHGDVLAMYELATLQVNGLVQTGDVAAAVALMKEAAERHHVGAQISFSSLYRIGEVVVRDNMVAYHWADIAKYNRIRLTDDIGGHLIVLAVNASLARRGLTPEQVDQVHQASLEWRQQYPDVYLQILTEEPVGEAEEGN